MEEEPSTEEWIDELPEEVIDEILEGEEFIVEEPVLTPEKLQEIIDESGIKEMVNNISAEFAENTKEILEDLSDWDVTLTDGLDDVTWEEPTEFTETSIEEVKEEPSIEEVKSLGLMDSIQKPERRRVQRVKNAISVENRAKLKKGPLWDFRTNRRDDDDERFE